MLGKTKQHIFFVDDELKVRARVHEVLEQAAFKVTSFARAADCLKRLRSERCDLLITDLSMPGMGGMALLTTVKEVSPWVPVLLITHDGDVATVAAAFKKGAVDFLKKPLNEEALLSAVAFALGHIPSGIPLGGRLLTATEAEVLRLILDGKTNKEIARARQRSRRTIEDQRCRIMHKLGADSTVELVRRGMLMGLLGPAGNASPG